MNDLKETIERVRELDAKATKGPWAGCRMVHHETGNPLTPDELAEYLKNTVIRSRGESGSDDFLFVSVQKEDGPADICHTGNGPTSPVNTALIAHYRTAAPKLATACEDLLAENAKLSAELANSKRVSRDRFDKIMEALEQRDAAEKQCDTLAAENARLRGLIKWQDISTAPKDGTEILVWNGGTIVHAKWGGSFHNAWIFEHREPRRTPARFTAFPATFGAPLQSPTTH